MSLLWHRRDLVDTPTNLIPTRNRAVGTVSVSPDKALAMSAVWAGLRIRADLISSLPVSVRRRLPDGRMVEVPSLPPVLQDPAGDGTGLAAWLYATQLDLDRVGNAFGIITARDGQGLPTRIELVPHSTVTVKVSGKSSRIVQYRIGGDPFDPGDVWHERQYVLPGAPLGLSPVSFAAFTIGNYLSAQEFAVQWFSAGGIPTVHVKNDERVLTAKEAAKVKRRYLTATVGREPFVTGSDWTLNTLSVAPNESQFLETMSAGINDIARFIGVPADILDGVTSKGTITYANITQRNLHLLTSFLGAPIRRREDALSQLTASPRRVHLDTDDILRLDPASHAAMLATEIQSRTLAPSEAREARNRPPFTPAQIAEFTELFGAPGGSPTDNTNPTPPDGGTPDAGS